jgi:dolichyl-phosphate-mannose-protein mannosyltransferase
MVARSVCNFAAISLKKYFYIQRGKNLENTDQMSMRLQYRIGFLMMAWALHYLPFFTMVRTLYLHHYLPSYMMSAMIAGGILEYVWRVTKHRTLASALLFTWARATIVVFFYFSPLTYGTKISTEMLSSRKWHSSWEWP